MKKLTYLFIIAIVTLMTMAADDCGLDALIASTDFRVQNRVQETVLSSPIISPYSVAISGQHVQDSSDFTLPFPSGSRYLFPQEITGTDGRYTIINGRAPATWRFTLHSGRCSGQFGIFLMKHGQEQKIDCVPLTGTMLPGFLTSPASIDTTAPPPTVTIYGQDMNCASGMPMVEYYDSEGTLAQQAQATTCAQDGSWISSPTPDLSSCYPGTYSLTVRSSKDVAIGSSLIYIHNPSACLPPPEGCPAGTYWSVEYCGCTSFPPF